MVFISKYAHKELIEELKKEYRVFLIGRNKKCYKEIEHHTDIQLIAIENKIFCDAITYQNLEKQGIINIKDLNIESFDSKLGNKYPESVIFNGRYMEGVFIHNTNYTEKRVLEYLKTKEIETYNVKQGYTGCALLMLKRDLAITSDKGLYEELKNYMEILLINEGYIELEGFEYGFIGGCGAVIDGVLYINGDLSAHPDYKNIIKFITEKNIVLKDVKNKKLTDIGGIIKIGM